MKLRTAKKAAYVTAAALLFGTVSGSVIAGMNYAGSQIITAYNAEETTSSSQIVRYVRQVSSGSWIARP